MDKKGKFCYNTVSTGAYFLGDKIYEKEHH